MPDYRLLVMRHAQSSRSSASDDHSRTLTAHGQRQPPVIAARLAELGWSPELVLSSDAERTKETWTLMASYFPGAAPHFSAQLYLASTHQLIAELCAATTDAKTVLALGHNPGWEHAVQNFSGVHVGLSPADVALLSTQAISWTDASSRTDWELTSVLRSDEHYADPTL